MHSDSLAIRAKPQGILQSCLSEGHAGLLSLCRGCLQLWLVLQRAHHKSQRTNEVSGQNLPYLALPTNKRVPSLEKKQKTNKQNCQAEIPMLLSLWILESAKGKYPEQPAKVPEPRANAQGKATVQNSIPPRT